MKKKIFAIVVCIAMLAIALAGGTMAYFTDTQEQVNTFTAGKVDIILYESKVVKDTDPNSPTFGDLIASGTSKTQQDQSYHLYPGMSVAKNPTIRLQEGSEDAYLAAIITVTFADGVDLDLMKKNMCLDWYDMLNVENLLTGEFIGDMDPKTDHPLHGVNNMGVYGNTAYSVYQIPDADNGKFTIYMFFEGAKSAEDADYNITLFDTLEIPDEWDNADMAVVNGMSIEVDAYAVQANGFADCYKAMVGAFGKETTDPFYFGN